MARRSTAPLHVVGRDDAADRADTPAVRGTFIGPDYARLRRTDWARLHVRGDARPPVDLPVASGRWLGTDKRRFER